MLITIYTAETNLFNWLHHALAVVIEGEVGAVRPLLPAQLRAQIQRHLAARSTEVSWVFSKVKMPPSQVLLVHTFIL